MNGRLRKFGLTGLVVGGTLLFGIGFAGAESPSAGNGAPGPKATHTGGAPFISGVNTAGTTGCGGDGGVTAAVASDL